MWVRFCRVAAERHMMPEDSRRDLCSPRQNCLEIGLQTPNDACRRKLKLYSPPQLQSPSHGSQKPNCWIASLPVAISAAKMPSTLIMAMRPLLISLLRMSSLYMSMPNGLPKLPGSLLESSRQASSRNAESTNRPKKPKTPSPVPRAPRPAGVFSKPGNLMKCWPTRPMDAIIATRPCFNSEARNLLKPFSSPTDVKPSGSKNPSGIKAPICSAGWKGGGGGGISTGAPVAGTAAGRALRATRRCLPAPTTVRAQAAIAAMLRLLLVVAPAELAREAWGGATATRGAAGALEPVAGARKAASMTDIDEC